MYIKINTHREREKEDTLEHSTPLTRSSSSLSSPPLLKIQQEREKELFKIQQERESELFKIRQEREKGDLEGVVVVK